ncbi:DUF7289 family protein [Archaeoglobus sp.]
MNRRGVSEVFGYILVFVMVTFALSLVYIQAMPQIQNQREYACLKSMESTFMTLKTVSELVAYNVTPSKTVNLRVDEGFLHTDDGTNVSVNGLTANSLVYEIGSNRIILLADTVFECFGDSCVVISKPKAFNISGYAYVSLINFSGVFGLSGSGVITLTNAGTTVSENGVTSINLTFHSDDPYISNSLAEAFGKALSENGFSTSVSENNVTIYGIKKLTVCLHNVTVS